MNETEEIQEPTPRPLESKYRKVLIAAKRSKQLQKGARPRVNMPNARNTRIALAEFEQGLIEYELTEVVER